MADSQQVAAIVLAAGRSSRMGEHKLLLPLGGEPLVRYAVLAACASTADPVIVVLGHNADAVVQALPADRYHIVRNADFAAGMATSLRAGVAAARALAGVALSGACILLGDQPLVSAAWLNRLLQEAARFPERVVAASYAGRRRSPVYFPSALFPELEQVVGDEGGRSVIQRHADRLRVVECDRPEVALDVDEPADFARLIAAWDRLHRDNS